MHIIEQGGLKMGILNYSTQINVSKTISEIQEMLVQSGAQKILTDYDGAGNITALSFMIETNRGLMPFKLPVNVQPVMQVINDQTRQKKNGRALVPPKFRNDMDQARRVAWRILKDWLEAQLALIGLQMVKIEQVFLPYVVRPDGRTLYEEIESRGFKGLLLEDKYEVE